MINFKIRIATPWLTMVTPWLAESGSRQLSDSLSFLLNIQKPTLGLSEYLREFEAKIGMTRKVV